MLKKNTMKTLVASAFIGGLGLTPLVGHDVAYAAKNHRVSLYSDYSRDLNAITWFELEPDSVSTFDPFEVLKTY